MLMLQQQLYVCIRHIAAGYVMLYKASSFCKILFETVSHAGAVVIGVVIGSEVKIKTTVRGNYILVMRDILKNSNPKER